MSRFLFPRWSNALLPILMVVARRLYRVRLSRRCKPGSVAVAGVLGALTLGRVQASV